METKALVDLGFTNAEAVVYTTLLELGPTKVGKIIEKTELQSSTIHNTLNSLIDKGFASFIKIGKIKIYQGVEPKIILQGFREREERFEEIMPKLEAACKLAAPTQTATMYEGMRGIANMFNELISDVKPGDKYYFYAVESDVNREKISDFFEKQDSKREERGLVVHGLARKQYAGFFKGRKHLAMRYVDFPLPINLNICNDKITIVTWSEQPIGILIKSKQISDSQRNFFEQLWKMAK